MFPKRFFGRRHFGQRYFPESQGTAPPTSSIVGPARVMRSSVVVAGPRGAVVSVSGARVGVVQ